MAAAVEIANAYVSLTTRMPNVKKDVESALGGSGVSGVTKKAGSTMGQSIVAGLTAGLVQPALNVIGSVASKSAAVFTKGFARLVSLDDARAKLTGLGHSAESVDSIMKNALASVRGTAFGMDQAAGVAGTLVAAGIAPGERLEKTLKLVADAATIAGSDMGDMGSIFAKVAGTGKLTGEVVAQLGDRGIPVLTKLAEMYGVSAEEAQKMVSAGKVSFEDFAQVMESTLGGAALSSGDTFKGALANVGASLGRIGAGLLGGTFSQLAPLLQSVTTALGPLESVAAAVGERVGNFLAPAFEFLTNALNGGINVGPLFEALQMFSPLGLAFQALMPVLPTILDLFSQVAQALVSGFAPVLPVLVSALNQVATVLVGALGSALQAILPALTPILTMLANLAAGVIPMLLPLVFALADVLGQVFEAVIPLVAALLSGLMPVFEAIVPVIGMLLAAILPVISALVGAFMPILQAIIPVVVSLLNAFLPLVATLVSALAPILQVVAQILAAVLVPIINIVVGVIQVLATVITWLVQNVIAPFFQGVVIPIVKNVANAFTSAFGGLGGFFEGIWNGIKNGFRAFVNFLIDGINGFLGALNGAGSFLSDITGGAISFSIPKIPRLADGATVLPRRGGTLAVLAEAGRAESVVDTGLLNRALEQGLAGSGPKVVKLVVGGREFDAYVEEMADGRAAASSVAAGVAVRAGKVTY